MAAHADDVAMGAGAGGDVDEDGLPKNSSRGQRWSRDATLLVLRAMVKHEWTPEDVEEVMGVPRSTAQTMLKRWQETGVVGTDTPRLPAAGRGSKRLGAAGIEFLLLLVKEYPTYYLREYVEKLELAGFTLHKSSVDAVLVEQGITFKQASGKRVRVCLCAEGGWCACGKAPDTPTPSYTCCHVVPARIIVHRSRTSTCGPRTWRHTATACTTG